LTVNKSYHSNQTGTLFAWELARKEKESGSPG